MSGTKEADVSLHQWERRKRFVGFGPDDVDILRELHLVAKTYADGVLEELYARWLQFDELRAFFKDDETLQRVKQMQRRYFISLTSGEYGMEYVQERLQIGRVHRRIGLSPRWYMGAYSVYMQIIIPRVLDAFAYDRARQARAFSALIKLIALDQELAMLAYLDPSMRD